MNELDLFAAAIGISDRAEREALLDRECAGRSDLRRRLDSLLDAHARSNPLLDNHRASDPNTTAGLAPPAGSVGTVIAGRYKLVEEIGDGGMGTVWTAEQREPVKRLVAVKLIKAGMDSKAVLARFEAERQALALMDHPNIATVLDGGTTDDGRPFFVMELVKGLPLTEYCDARKLSLNDRLDLFVQICSAVQHAHQKAVIHRDLKPSNILVTEHDGNPVPKVIDFGLVKALNAANMLTERTLHTAYGTVVGTPLYMAPEQVGINSLDVDTRTDIYALGVILYELLTGTTPLEKAKFKEAAWEEVKRLIREEEPPRPSARLSSDKTLPSLAASRQVDSAQLSRMVRGELDWIVMKALEKDRSRRYETATGLSKDVQRYLTGDTVEACPPTLGYRLRKTYRRKRGAILVAGSIASVLLIGSGVSLAFAIMAKQAERRAVQQEQVAQENAQQAATSAADALNAASEREMAIVYLSRVLAKFNPYRHATGNPSIQEVLNLACKSLNNDDASSDENAQLTPIVRAKVRGVFGRMYMDIHLYNDGQRQLEQAYEELRELNGPDDVETLQARLAYAEAVIGGRQGREDLELAEKTLKDIRKRRDQLIAAGRPVTDKLRGIHQPLARSIFLQSNFEGALAELKIALATPGLEEDSLIVARIQRSMANMLMRSSNPENIRDARDLCDRAIRICMKRVGPNHQDTIWSEAQLAVILDDKHEFIDAAKRMRELVPRMIDVCKTEKDPSVENITDWYANSCLFAGQPILADEPTRKLLELGPQLSGPNHPNMRRYKVYRAWYFVQIGQIDEAEKLLKEVCPWPPTRDMIKSGLWDDSSIVYAYSLLGECLLHKKQYQEAERNLLETEKQWQNFPPQLGSASKTRNRSQALHFQRLIKLYRDWEQPEKAAYWQDRLDKIPK